MRALGCFAGGLGDWQPRERGSDLSPLSKAACPPTAVANKELAGAVMDGTGEEGILAVKFPLPFTTGPRGALEQGEASRSHLGVHILELAWQMLVIISHSLANLPFYQFSFSTCVL